MPTGYTAGIKKGINFREYALLCSRAFGAMVMLRDEPLSSDIPDGIKPSEYYNEKLIEVERIYNELKQLSINEAGIRARQDYDNALDRYTQQISEAKALEEKYKNMLEQCKKWQPPTPEHENLKKFMIEQIEQSISFDCNISYLKIPQLVCAEEWLSVSIKQALKDISYYSKQKQEEIQRCKGATEWIQSLKKSLPLQGEPHDN